MRFPSGNNLQRGFTLVEILLVLMIMALLAAIVYPSFSTVHGDISGQSRRYTLLAALRQARWQGLLENEDYRAVITKNKDVWNIKFEKFDSARNQYLAITEPWADFDSDNTPEIISISQRPSSSEELNSFSQFLIEFKTSGVGRDTFMELGGGKGKWFITVIRPGGIVSLVAYDNLKQIASQRIRIDEYFNKTYGNGL